MLRKKTETNSQEKQTNKAQPGSMCGLEVKQTTMFGPKVPAGDDIQGPMFSLTSFTFSYNVGAKFKHTERIKRYNCMTNYGIGSGISPSGEKGNVRQRGQWRDDEWNKSPICFILSENTFGYSGKQNNEQACLHWGQWTLRHPSDEHTL